MIGLYAQNLLSIPNSTLSGLQYVTVICDWLKRFLGLNLASSYTSVVARKFKLHETEYKLAKDNKQMKPNKAHLSRKYIFTRRLLARVPYLSQGLDELHAESYIYLCPVNHVQYEYTFTRIGDHLFLCSSKSKYTDDVTAHHLSQWSAFMLKAQESFQVQDNERGKIHL